MGLFDVFKRQLSGPTARPDTTQGLMVEIMPSLRAGMVPNHVRERLEASRAGRMPWTATLTPAELLIVRSHELRPIAAVSATCWMHYGWSWTEGHSQGWETAVRRLREEARAAGANAVLDVKMRTVPMDVEHSMDFTLTGTAVRIEGLPSSTDPIIATVPALEFVKLIDADVVPTGLAVGARFEWMTDWRDSARMAWMGNGESRTLTDFWEGVRRAAHAELRRSAARQGNGALAHINFSEMFEIESGQNQPKRYLGRHIVIATTIDCAKGLPLREDVKIVVDLRDEQTPLTGAPRHHQSYDANDQEGPI